MKVIKWAYRHGALFAEAYGTLDEALRAAAFASDAGEEALQAFEVPSEGRVIEKDEAYKLMHAKQDEMDAEYRKRYGEWTPPKYVIDIKSPDGKWTPHIDVRDDSPTEREHELVVLLGRDRVRTRPHGVQLSC